MTPLATLDALRLLDLRHNRIRSVQALFGERVMDDGDTGYREVGESFQGNLSPVTGAFEEDYRFRNVSEEDGVFGAFWTFDDVSPGNWEVLASWPAADSRSEAVAYTVATASSVVAIGDVFREDLVAPLPPLPLSIPDEPGARQVTIDTDQLTITGDGDANDNAFYGTGPSRHR